MRRRGEQQDVRARARSRCRAARGCRRPPGQPATPRGRNRSSPARRDRFAVQHRIAKWQPAALNRCGRADRTIRMASSPGAMGASHGDGVARTGATIDIDRCGFERLPRVVERRAVRPRQHAVRVVHADDDVGPAGDRPVCHRRCKDERERDQRTCERTGHDRTPVATVECGNTLH